MAVANGHRAPPRAMRASKRFARRPLEPLAGASPRHEDLHERHVEHEQQDDDAGDGGPASEMLHGLEETHLTDCG
ncbi:hypothetical protein P43SY_011216 [Pythium insidiosum]|uniref:Uncharacterized protein n=1 Tax=Pythium insidiosum TaxID=114742 RepID=A0AAD5Q450_PYTIN|nr:hypothetical protein P43SY_011216 [Pythium insidiosum]